MENVKKRGVLSLISISIIDILRQISSSGVYPLIYIVCIDTLKRNDIEFGLANSLMSIGYLIFSYLCGFIGDNFPIKKTLLLSLLLSFFSLCAIPFGSILNVDYYFLFLISLFIISFSDTLFQTLLNSRLPELVNKNNLTFGNSVLQLTSALGTFLGPIVVSISFRFGKVELAALVLAGINGLNIIVAMKLFVFGFLGNETKSDGKKRSGFNLFNSLVYIIKKPELIFIIMSTMLINFSFSLISIVQILHMVRIWNIADTRALTIYSYSSIGAIIGSIFAPLLVKRSYKVAVVCGIVMPSLLIIFLLLPNLNFLLVAGIFIMLTFSRNVGAVIRMTIQQLTIDQTIRGVITGMMMTITWGINPLGNVISGILSQKFGTTFVLWIAASCFLFASVLMLVLVKYFVNQDRGLHAFK